MRQFRRTAIPLTIIVVLLGARGAARAEPTSATAHANTWVIELGISPFVGFGTAPNGAFGVASHMGMHSSSIPLSLAIEGYGDFPNPWTSETLPEVRMTASQVGGAIVPCWRPNFFLVCGVVTGSNIHAKATLVEGGDSKEASVRSFRMGGRVGIGASVGDQFGLRLYGDVLGAILTARAIFKGKEVWRTSPLSGNIGATLLCFF